MKHSVIIPCYNCAETLGEQLEALSQQAFEESWEVIVADNGSSDDVAAVIEAYADRLPRLRLIDASQRRGAGYARNQAANVAQGEQLSFIDADDVAAPGWLKAISRALDEHEFVASRHDFTKLNAPEILATRNNTQDRGLQAYTNPPFLPHSGGCGLGIRRWLHHEVGGFDESFFKLQDTDYCWRVQLAGHELVFVPEAVVHVRWRDAPEDIFRQARQNGEANVHLYSKYRSLGMPRLSWKRGLIAWLYLLRTSPRVLDATERTRWMRQFHWRLGRLIGSFKYHTLSL